MALPFFYTQELHTGTVTLDEDTSKHITGVLRMKAGDSVLLTDGKGAKANAVITDDHRKRSVVRVDAIETEAERTSKICIAVSLVKNTARFEWFLEKATEVGISEIVPLLCARTERQRFRHDRMQAILISAMLQSQQCWLPLLHEPTPFENVLQTDYPNKFIAHCLPQQKQSLYAVLKKLNGNRLMLIGPEGDFTESEIEQAIQQNFLPVTLGTTRLRTETAGIVAATLLCMDL
jgi:16S rRNA (uracil1498-N3)-methyltransferase